jgi:hypothetical protein
MTCNFVNAFSIDRQSWWQIQKVMVTLLLLSAFQVEVLKWTGDSGQTLNRLYLDKFILGQLIGKRTVGCEINIARE